ncbi:MAG: TonB-dependent receptor [Steroidobacteraceae bacterium]
MTRSVAILALACSGIASIAAAQESTTPKAETLEAIIVTARRVEENLQEVPTAVTAFQDKDIEAKQIKNAGDLMYNVPSLSVAQTAAGTGPNYGLRAQRQFVGVATGVVTYLADVPVDANTTYRHTYDMASLQVLKGPQGTLFGANSNGGAFLFVPKAPTDEFEGFVEGALGNYDRREMTAAINLPVNDKLAFRIAGRMVRQDGYTKNVNPCPLNLFKSGCQKAKAQDDEDYESYRVAMSWKPTDWLKNDLTYFDTYDHSVGPSSVAFAFGGGTQLFFAPPLSNILGTTTTDEALALQDSLGKRKVYSDQVKRKFHDGGLSNVTAIDINDKLTIKNIFGWQHSDDDIWRDQDGSPIAGSFQGSRPTSVPAVETYTEELQVLGSFMDDKVKYVAGGFFSRLDDDGSRNHVSTFVYYLSPAQYQTLGALLPFLPFPLPPSLTQLTDLTGVGPGVKMDTDVDAYYGNLTFDLGSMVEGLSLSGGYRHTKTDTTQKARQDLVNGQCLAQEQRNTRLDADTCTIITENNDSGNNYSAALQYQINDRAMVYFATRKGFKPGGVNMASVQDPNFFTYEPEEITDYELGIKTDFNLGDVLVRANIALYTSDYKDIQHTYVEQQPSGVPAIVTYNAQKATIQGVEPEIQIQLTPNFNVGVFYSYLDASFDKFLIERSDGTTTDKSDETFSAVSEHTVGVNWNYRVPLDGRYGEFAFGGNFYYRSKQTFAESTLGVPTDLFVPGYDVTNLRLDWVVPNTRVKVAGMVTNVFDKAYVVGGADYTTSVGYAIKQYGPPRMYRFQVGYEF